MTYDDELDEGPGDADADLMDEATDDSFNCPECGLLAWGDAEVCGRCGRAFTMNDRLGADTWGQRGKTLWKTVWIAFVVVVVIVITIRLLT